MRARLDRAITQLAYREVNPNRFERQWPPSNIAKWRRLQKELPTNSKYYANVTFILAYYGVDYERNLERLLKPYRDWRNQYRKPPSRSDGNVATSEAYDENSVDVEDIPPKLALLYQKHHDARSVGYLLDMRTDGALAEAQADALEHLWPENKATLLRSAFGSATRLHNLADMLAMQSETKPELRAEIREVQRLRRHPDRRVSSAAQKLASLLSADLRSDRPNPGSK
jgi:hypothetical protein